MAGCEVNNTPPPLTHLFLLHRYDDGGVPSLHQDEVHQQTTRAAVPVIERVDVDQPVVRQGGHFYWVEGQRLVRVEPIDKFFDKSWDVVGGRRDKITDEYLQEGVKTSFNVFLTLTLVFSNEESSRFTSLLTLQSLTSRTLKCKYTRVDPNNRHKFITQVKLVVLVFDQKSTCHYCRLVHYVLSHVTGSNSSRRDK